MLDPGGPCFDVGSEPGDLMLLVGPEGGWTDAERSSAIADGVDIRGLGRTVLRAETAPLAALAAVHQCWGWGLWSG
jgi:16S rRNA (uracil1498-N3)-methyltransferase